jgi:chromate transport protein ChrA
LIPVRVVSSCGQTPDRACCGKDAPDDRLLSAAMVVLVIVAVACFIAGMWAATTWLPALAEGPVGTLVYFVVCGLAGAVLALIGIRVWGIVRELEESRRLLDSSQIVASGLVVLLWESGSLAALALIAYLLAPKTEHSESNRPTTES